jgi:plastocyanin
MRRRTALIGLVMAIGLVAAACSGDDSGGGGSPSSAGGAGAGGGSAGGGTTIVAQNFAFSPDRVSVPAGAVTLTVTNRDSAEHTFTLDDGSSDTSLDPGSTQTIELDVSKTVGWHCSIHPSMTGTIEVT